MMPTKNFLDYRRQLIQFWVTKKHISEKKLKSMSAWKVEFMVREIMKRGYATILEIGTRYGITAMTLGNAMHRAGRLGPGVYSVDIADVGQEAALQEFDNVDRVVKFSVYEDGITERFMDEHPHLNVDLLVIDGKHTFKAVKRDHEVFGAKVRAGGMIIFNDVGHGRYPEVQGETPSSYVRTLDVTFFPDDNSGLAYLVKE